MEICTGNPASSETESTQLRKSVNNELLPLLLSGQTKSEELEAKALSKD